jgi:hypothetical protein
VACHAGYSHCRWVRRLHPARAAPGRLLAYLVSNALWIVWGLHSSAYALILLQMCLVVMSIRGEGKSAAAQEAQPTA